MEERRRKHFLEVRALSGIPGWSFSLEEFFFYPVIIWNAWVMLRLQDSNGWVFTWNFFFFLTAHFISLFLNALNIYTKHNFKCADILWLYALTYLKECKCIAMKKIYDRNYENLITWLTSKILTSVCPELLVLEDYF